MTIPSDASTIAGYTAFAVACVNGATALVKSGLETLFKNHALHVGNEQKVDTARTELIQSLLDKVDRLEKSRVDDQDARLKEREEAHQDKLQRQEEIANLNIKLNLQGARIAELESHNSSYLKKIAEQDQLIVTLTAKVDLLEEELNHYKVGPGTGPFATSVVPPS